MSTSRPSSPFRYCPRCAHPLHWSRATQEHPRRLVCAKCGFTFFNNPVAASEAFIIHNRKVLMVRRAHPPRAGYWDFPGGFYEGVEDPIAGVKREVYEELGARLTIKKLLGAYHDLYYYDDRIIRVMILGYVAQISGKIKLSKENNEYSWESFPIKRSLAFRHHTAAVRDLRKYLQRT